MPVTYNKAGFQSVASAADLPVLPRTYCNLVFVELALKDSLSSSGLKHDIPLMLKKIGLANKPQRAALNQYICDFTNKVSALHVTSVDGSPSRARASAYPDIRYIRHESDWNEKASPDSDIEELRVCIGKIRGFLKTSLRIH